MRNLVVNPHTTVEMTEQVDKAMNAVKRDDTVLVAVNPAEGPAGLSSGFDEIIAGYELI